MTDYDITKVSPRDWRLFIEEIKAQTWLCIDNGERRSDTPVLLVPASTVKLDDIKHFILCVNHHDPLVEALEWCCKYPNHVDGIPDWVAQALAAAKGD